MKSKGMQTFLLIWSGQVFSKIGTGITRFALLIWAYQQTDQATAVALLSFFSFVPLVVVSPFAGVWIDRLDRRKVMWLADAGAGFSTCTLLLLLATGQLAIWHLYLAQFLAGTFEAFQGPAFTAVSTQVLPPEQYTRASGLRSIVGGSAAVATPFLAGLLLPFIGLSGVMIFDLATFGLAVITLLLAVVPPLPQATTAVSIETGFWLELRQGFTYIWQERVPAALQGRVFAVHQMARQAMTPLGILLGGLLADHWFEPAMQANGAFSALFAPLVGSGPGSGIAVMFLGTAVLGIVVGFIGYRIPAVYRIEEGTRAIL